MHLDNTNNVKVGLINLLISLIIQVSRDISWAGYNLSQNEATITTDRRPDLTSLNDIA